MMYIFSGDFFFYPAEDLPGLEKSLNSVAADTTSVSEAVTQFSARQTVESPGVLPADFAHVLVPKPI